MAEKIIPCPKCGRMQQQSNKECESCGLIFARYKKMQQRRRELKEQEAQKKQAKNKQFRTIIQVIALVGITTGVTAYFLRPATEPTASQTITESLQQPETKITAPISKKAPVTTDITSQPVAQTGSIEHARQATVSIKTPWGTGSGFFISPNYMVTNKHVIEIDQKQLDEFRHKIDATQKMIKLEQEKLHTWKRKLKKMPQGPSREQLKIIIAESKRDLQQILPQFNEAQQRLEKMEQPANVSDIKVILADGTEHYVNFMLKSDHYDLTLLAVTVSNHPILKPAPKNVQLKQGDKVYTIGSPVGLRNTVTAGIFSGYRKNEKTDKMYLQTDAPINPGNSGGPLIDERGYVWGVNTMILRNTEGIGFAIPIEKVFEDFGASLY